MRSCVPHYVGGFVPIKQGIKIVLCVAQELGPHLMDLVNQKIMRHGTSILINNKRAPTGEGQVPSALRREPPAGSQMQQHSGQDESGCQTGDVILKRLCLNDRSQVAKGEA